MSTYILKNENIEPLEKVLFDKNHQFKIVSYKEIQSFSQNIVSLFCLKYGLYCVPTRELIDFLRSETDENNTIEIGAGSGIISRELNITATDSFMQLVPKYKALYEKLGQTIINYGNNVVKMDANHAVNYFKPDFVIASWCTHKFNPDEYWREGNEVGIDESQIVKTVKKYIHIGNEHIHQYKPILQLRHREIRADWLVSRALQSDQNVIWIWENPNK